MIGESGGFGESGEVGGVGEGRGNTSNSGERPWFGVTLVGFLLPSWSELRRGTRLVLVDGTNGYHVQEFTEVLALYHARKARGAERDGPAPDHKINDAQVESISFGPLPPTHSVMPHIARQAMILDHDEPEKSLHP
jgi:hypothetical protein